MTDAPAQSMLTATSNALVALHKEQFGRGPTTARSYFAGPDALVCVLEDVLLPAERNWYRPVRPSCCRDNRPAHLPFLKRRMPGPHP